MAIGRLKEFNKRRPKTRLDLFPNVHYDPSQRSLFDDLSDESATQDELATYSHLAHCPQYQSVSKPKNIKSLPVENFNTTITTIATTALSAQQITLSSVSIMPGAVCYRLEDLQPFEYFVTGATPHELNVPYDVFSKINLDVSGVVSQAGVNYDYIRYQEQNTKDVAAYSDGRESYNVTKQVSRDQVVQYRLAKGSATVEDKGNRLNDFNNSWFKKILSFIAP